MLTQRIREEMQSIHDRIEQLPISLAMASGGISRQTYLALLEQLRLVHVALESHYSHEMLVPFITTEAYRTQAVDSDIAFLGGSTTRTTAWGSTNEMLGAIEQAATEHPLQLLGMVYVLEGSRMGSMVLFKPLAQALQTQPLPGHGLDYHIEGMHQRPASWQRFKKLINDTPFTPEECGILVEATQITMRGLFNIYAEASLAV